MLAGTWSYNAHTWLVVSEAPPLLICWWVRARIWGNQRVADPTTPSAVFCGGRSVIRKFFRFEKTCPSPTRVGCEALVRDTYSLSAGECATHTSAGWWAVSRTCAPGRAPSAGPTAGRS